MLENPTDPKKRVDLLSLKSGGYRAWPRQSPTWYLVLEPQRYTDVVLVAVQVAAGWASFT